MADPLSILLTRVVPRRLLVEARADGRYSRFRWPRWVTYDYDLGWQHHSTRSEYLAWFRENCPNGYCICYPERGIVCGQHDPRIQLVSDKPR